MRSGLAAITLCLLFAAAAPAVAQWQAPPLAARTLADREFALPADLPHGPTLLIIGFTEDSRSQTSAWTRALATDADLQAAVAVFQVAVIEDVPALMRRFVVGSIRRGVPKRLHDRFLLVTRGTKDWETLVSYSHPDAAYLVLLDRRRKANWRGVGEPSALSLEALRSALSELHHAQ